jgi:glycosyltransferase involved in cell wall biosynthesis
LGDLTESYEIIFCLDPSPDKTENLLNVLTSQDNRVKLIKFSRRFGQPAATMAGIINISGQRCVIIDAELHDPPELIKDLNNKMHEGFDVVYAIRNSREGFLLMASPPKVWEKIKIEHPNLTSLDLEIENSGVSIFEV